MLDNLSARLGQVVKSIRGRARLSEENIGAALREVRVALLEADVALPVVKEFMTLVKERALGYEVIGSLTPDQALIEVVAAVLTELMGQENAVLNLAAVPPAVILLAGLQGAGKTTTAGKLAALLKNKDKKKILTVSADVYRPAAIEQLSLLAAQVGVDFFPADIKQSPQEIVTAAQDYAKRHHYDILIVDTAGRLAVDAAMMTEIKELYELLTPVETLFVVDAMLGQDAVNTAKAFTAAITVTGIILTKMDGDSRGGAALSTRYITGKPIKFIGTGEKINGLEPFYPERLVKRILGMGDVLSLIEDVRHSVNEADAAKMVKKLRSGKNFDLNDFQAQIKQMKKMGSIDDLLQKMPGMGNMTAKIPAGQAEKAIIRTEAIICSMTAKERAWPQLLKAGRKRRIALGSGTSVQEVNKLLKQFEQTQKVMKQFGKGGMGKFMQMARGMRGIFPR